MINLENISKTFLTPEGLLKAVDNVSLAIEAGDIFGIIGFSGAGKSTLLRTINLLEKPDPGSRVTVDGRILTDLPKEGLRQARQSIGMVFQHFNLLNNRTVAGNISFPLEIAGKPVAERERRIEECLAIVGLTDKARTYPSKLSGGQKQRVAIARALANKPTVLLCDEPTSSVDPQMTGSILASLQEINQLFGITIVIVTHEMEVVNSICHKVAVMEDGKVVERFATHDAGFIPQSDLARVLLQSRFSATHQNDYAIHN